MRIIKRADLIRKSYISVLTRKQLVTDLDKLDGIENENDLEDTILFFEQYIAKYPKCGLKIDYNTSALVKSKNIQKIADYVSKLSATRFEKFSALLIKFFEYEITYATKASHDQGIDFLGVKRFKFFDSHRKSYLMGQAKKYNVLVDVSEVRGFAGSIFLFRSKEFAQSKNIYQSILLKSFTSVEGIFITSYFFSNPALKLCENSDIITLDFIDIVLLTEKAILTKSLKIETNDIFIKSKADKEVDAITILN